MSKHNDVIANHLDSKALSTPSHSDNKNSSAKLQAEVSAALFVRGGVLILFTWSESQAVARSTEVDPNGHDYNKTKTNAEIGANPEGFDLHFRIVLGHEVRNVVAIRSNTGSESREQCNAAVRYKIIDNLTAVR
jgi:hypothetical protein